jgi:DNA-binding transcriptional LysR family regulator
LNLPLDSCCCHRHGATVGSQEYFNNAIEEISGISAVNLRDLDLNLLVVFQAIWLYRNVSTAAERLDMTQSATSNALRRLRKHFGDPLFLRTSGGMAPTPLASQLAEPVGYALSTLSSGLDVKVGFEPEKSERQFTIGMTDIGEIVFLPALLAHLKRVAPGVSVQAVSLPAPQMRAGMEGGSIDLAVGFLPALRAGFFQQRLFTQKYVCLLGRSWKLAEGKLTREQFLAARHALVNAEGTGHAIVEQMLEATGIQRAVHLRVPHFVAIPFIVETTDLIVTAPEKLGAALAQRLAIRVVPHPIRLPEFQVNQFWHRRFRQDAANVWLRGVFTMLFRERSS